jgi:4-hydroxy-2-oxoheptanedioate aldolase
MLRNGVKRLWAGGKPAINGWLSIGNPFTAEIMAAQGYDSVTIDMQHGALDYSAALPMMQAMRASGRTLMARVPWNEPGIIMKALDAGAYGIIAPMVNTRSQAEAFVSAMRYPPLGTRSFGPTRAAYAACGAPSPDYAAGANDEMLAFAMIETAEAVANVEEIVRTPGLDAIYIGPADLTLGVTQGRLPPGFDRQEPEMIEVIQGVLKAAKEAGIRAGIHCGSPAYAAKAIDWGFDLTTISGDTWLLANAAKESVPSARSLIANHGAEVDTTASPGGGY